MSTSASDNRERFWENKLKTATQEKNIQELEQMAVELGSEIEKMPKTSGSGYDNVSLQRILVVMKVKLNELKEDYNKQLKNELNNVKAPTDEDKYDNWDSLNPEDKPEEVENESADIDPLLKRETKEEYKKDFEFPEEALERKNDDQRKSKISVSFLQNCVTNPTFPCYAVNTLSYWPSAMV